jgi:hypothetical protein
VSIDDVYNERNRVVAVFARLALAQGWRAGLSVTAIEGWDPAWHNCVYIETPEGQLSWHFHDREAHLFAGLPYYAGTWDGHSTDEKYARMERFAHRADNEYAHRDNRECGIAGCGRCDPGYFA